MRDKLQKILHIIVPREGEVDGMTSEIHNQAIDKATDVILDLLDKSLPSHKRQVHVEHGEIMPSVAQCKWYFDGYEQAIADVRKVIKED